MTAPASRSGSSTGATSRDRAADRCGDDRRGDAQRDSPFSPSCARSRICSISSAGGSFSAIARPISAMRAAASICRLRFSRPGAVRRRCEAALLAASLSRAFDDGFFTGGRLTFTSGANAGARATIKSHRARRRARPSRSVAAARARRRAGRRFDVVAGCDKSVATCRTIRQYRQFPRLSAHARQRLRDRLSELRRRRRWTAGACFDERQALRARRSSPRRGAGSARPIGIRRRSSGRLRLPRPGARRLARAASARARSRCRPIRPTGRRRAARRRCALAAHRHFVARRRAALSRRRRAAVSLARRRCPPSMSAIATDRRPHDPCP